MKKFVSTLVIAVFLAQSLLPSYMYAAASATTKPAATPAQYEIQNPYQQLVDRFLRTDVTTVDPITLLQMGAYLYVYEKNGIAGFDFEQEDASQAMMTINYFITSYAPNVGFLANDKGANEEYFKVKALAWKDAYPSEYAKVYDYVKTVQSKYTVPSALPTTPRPDNTPVDPKNGTVPTRPAQPTKLGEQCDVMYAKLMKEYESLIAIKDIPYTKIADVKERISKVQQGEGCTVAAAVPVTQQDIQKENEAIVEKVRKTLNFGSANMRVMPDNVVPAYCENNGSSELRTQLLDIDPQMIRSMKGDLDLLMQSEEIVGSSIKRNALNFVSQELGLVESVQSTQQGDAASVFHNMLQGLVLVGDSIVNTRGIYSMMDIANANKDKLGELTRFIGEEFDSIKSLKTKGNADYSWDSAKGTFVRSENKDGVIRFKLPGSKDSSVNNVSFTIATAKTKSIQVSEKPYVWTEYQGPMTLEQFAQEARNNGSVWGNQLDATTLGRALTQEIIGYAPDYYLNNDPTQPTVFFAEANGEQKLFKDWNLTAVMPAGKFSNPRGTTYVIGEEGKLIDMYYYEEAPEQIKAKLEVDTKLVAGLDVAIAYDEQAIRDGHGSSFPLRVNARVYIADYLLTLSASRVLDQSVWSLSTDLRIQGPTICNFLLSAKMYYGHDGEQGYPSIEESSTNIQQANAQLLYNNNTVTVDIADVVGFVSAAADAVSSSQDGNMLSALIDPIQQYVSAAYYFDNNKLADILPDEQNMAVVQYTHNGETESIIDGIGSYSHLLRIDNIMNFMAQYIGEEDKGGYQSEKPEYSEPDNKDATTYQVSIGNYYQDDQYLYVSYNYGDMYGNTTDIYPEKTSIEVMTYSGPVSYQFELFDGYTYRAPVVGLLSDPSVVAMYIYALYNGQEYMNYIIGSSDAYHAGYTAPNNQVATSPYVLQGQSTSYPDVQTQEIVMSLYEKDVFVQYVEPTIKLYLSYGAECYTNPDGCSYTDITIYPTYLDGVPTYIIDTMQVDDESVFEATISISYTDPAGFEHNEKYPLKKPIQ